MQYLNDFFTSTPLWELLFIFFSKIVEVSLGTLRIILINKGYRRLGVFLSFFEVMIWIFVASRVISNISLVPFKAVIYSLGYASGVYLGSRIENYLAFGKIEIKVITSEEKGIRLAQLMRDEGYGVTILDAYGKDNKKKIIMIYANRKGKSAVISKIVEFEPKSLIVSSEIATIEGGYLKKI